MTRTNTVEAQAAEPGVSISLLGRLRVVVDGRPVEITAERERTLVALLAVAGDLGFETTALVDELWENPTAGSKGTLQTYVSNLRRTLTSTAARDSRVIERVADSYRFDPALVVTDVSRFRGAVRQARNALAAADPDAIAASELLADALALFEGPLDPSLVGGIGRLAGEATALDKEFLEATWLWIELEIQAGRATDVVPELDRLTRGHPTDERFWRQLMLAYWQTGRQQQALQAYQEVRRVLAEEVGILPTPSLQDLEQAILRHDPALGSGETRPRAPGSRRRSAIPATLNAFIGREGELARLESLLADSRLVTLRGAGGNGKTRLAKEFARRVEARFEGGAWWVAFGEVEDTSDDAEATVVETIATAIGMIRRGQGSLIDALIDHVAEVPMLLVLDNCEHLIDAVAEVVTTMLTDAPDLRVLATTRENLRVVGETTVVVEPLGVAPLPDVEMTDAARLFFDRADALGSPLDRGAEALAAVEQICERLDGSPLAIELASALTDTTSLGDIRAELEEHRFELLTVSPRGAAPQHRTLEAVVDWSYDRLDEDERTAFDSLSVFPGSFTLAAAEAIFDADGPSARRLLDGLVRKSLVETVGFGQGAERYRILETLRQYGLRRLADSGRTAEVEGRFVTHFVELPDRMPYDPTTSVVEWFAELEPDVSNLRFAIRRAMANDQVDDLLRLVESFHWYFNYVGSLTDTQAWLRSIVPDRPEFAGPRLSRHETVELTPRQEVMAYTSLAALANFKGSYGETGHWADRAVTSARDLGDVHLRHTALVIQGATAVFENRQSVAVAAFTESLELSTAIGDRWSQGVALAFLAVGSRRAADQQRQADPSSDWPARLAAVTSQLERAYEIFSQVQDDRGLALVMTNLGRVEEHRGNFDRAVPLLERGISLAESSGDPILSGLAHNNRGRIAVGQRDDAFAVECFARAIDFSESVDRSRVLFSSSVEWLGIIAARHGDVEPLLRIAAATEQYREAPPTAAALPELHAERQAAREALGDERADELEADGRSMEPAAVKALAVRAARAAVG